MLIVMANFTIIDTNGYCCFIIHTITYFINKLAFLSTTRNLELLISIWCVRFNIFKAELWTSSTFVKPFGNMSFRYFLFDENVPFWLELHHVFIYTLYISALHQIMAWCCSDQMTNYCHIKATTQWPWFCRQFVSLLYLMKISLKFVHKDPVDYNPTLV